MGSRCRKKQQPKEPEIQANFTFAVDERVLCYEPDLNKTRVLYDSKVLDVVEKKHHGKSHVEYKIHFSGWNSSWDRYVDEEFVLKDTDENRALQKELKEKADVFIQALKKKKKKKTFSEILKEAKIGKDANASTSKAAAEKDSNNKSDSGSDSSDQGESSDDEDMEIPRIFLSDYMKAVLEVDCYNLTKRNLLVKIPADISVICILEAYVKHLAFTELASILNQRESYLKQDKRHPLSETLAEALSVPHNTKHGSSKTQLNLSIDPWLNEIDRLFRRVRQAQEIIYGLKTIFDYMLYVKLLYRGENEQYETSKRLRPVVPTVNTDDIIPKLPPLVEPTPEPAGPKAGTSAAGDRKGDKQESRRRGTDSTPATRSKSDVPTRSQIKALENPHDSEKNYAAWQKKVQMYVASINSWQMIPLKCFEEEEVDLSMLYGLIHLTRLFVKLPEILNQMSLPRRKMRIISLHVNQIFQYMEGCHDFSDNNLYVNRILPFEEDRIQIAAAKRAGPKQVNPTIIQPNKDQFSTKSHRHFVAEKINQPNRSKIVEIQLSDSEGEAEEHQITISMATPQASIQPKIEQVPAREQPVTKQTKENNETSTKSPSKPAKDESVIAKPKTKMLPTSSPSKRKSEVGKESPAKQQQHQQQQQQSTSTNLQTTPRHVRESAANAAFKNAHIFASQQNFSRATPVVKRDAKEQETTTTAGTRKRRRSSPSETPTLKRVTRTTLTTDPHKLPSSRKVVDESSNSASSRSPEKSVKEKPEAKITPRTPVSPERAAPVVQSADRSKSSEVAVDSKARRSSSSRRDSVEKEKGTAKKISSPRTSTKSDSFHKESTTTTPLKNPLKLPVPVRSATSIRLRSKSGERQLRSKGSLINALCLDGPLRNRSSPSKTFREKSPLRRDSLHSSNPNKESHNLNNQTSAKQTEQGRSLRSRR